MPDEPYTCQQNLFSAKIILRASGVSPLFPKLVQMHLFLLLFQAYGEIKDFVCWLMGISRAIWGNEWKCGICVDQPELCWQGLGGGSNVLKFCLYCGCQLPRLPDSLFLVCVCVVMDHRVEKFPCSWLSLSRAWITGENPAYVSKGKAGCLSLTHTCFAHLLRFDSK